MNQGIPAADLMVFIDVICPWCYVGKRRLEKALASMGGKLPIRVSWLPFQLNPDMPQEGIERRIYRIRKFGSWERSQRLDAELAELGAQEGISFRYDLITRTPNTFRAHRLIWRTRQTPLHDRLVDALLRAYFTEGREVGDIAVLADIAAEIGVDRPEIVSFLNGEEGAVQVSQEEEAARRAGLSGVPAFILNRRPLLVGAHPPEVLASALRNAIAVSPNV